MRAAGSALHHQNGLRRWAGKRIDLEWGLRAPTCHAKGEQRHGAADGVTRLLRWGNRRWHLADSLTRTDLLGVGWLLWFWNYSLDELEHLTQKKKKAAAEMGQTGAALSLLDKQAGRRRDEINLTSWMGFSCCSGSDWLLGLGKKIERNPWLRDVTAFQKWSIIRKLSLTVTISIGVSVVDKSQEPVSSWSSTL